jgi:hypothetical protein
MPARRTALAALLVLGSLAWAACARSDPSQPQAPGGVTGQQSGIDAEHLPANWDSATDIEREVAPGGTAAIMAARARAMGRLAFTPVVPVLGGRRPAHVWVSDPAKVREALGRGVDLSYVFPAGAPGFYGDGRVLVTEEFAAHRSDATTRNMGRTWPAALGRLVTISGHPVFMNFGSRVGRQTAALSFADRGMWVTIAGPAISPAMASSLGQQFLDSR